MRGKAKAKVIVNDNVDVDDNYASLRKGKGKVKVTIDDVDFGDNHTSSSDDLNNASLTEDLDDAYSILNAKSEIDEQLAHNNDYNYSLIIKRLATLEAENERLQSLLNKETFEMNNQQATDAKPNKRKLKILDESDNDTSNNNSKLIEQKEKSKIVETIVDNHEVIILLLFNILKLIFFVVY